MRIFNVCENERRWDDSGFTLIELMLAMLLSVFVLGAIYSVYLNHQKSSTVQNQTAELQQNIRAALYIIERETRMAGYDPTGNAGAGITIATNDNFVFTQLADNDLNDNDNDGATDEPGELLTIDYALYDGLGDGDLELGRKTGVNYQGVVENIDAIEFLYTLDNGTQSINPADPSEVRAVTITVLARASKSDSEFDNTLTYTPASGNNAWDINGATAGIGNPPNDNFRRRQLSATVQCRNLGL